MEKKDKEFIKAEVWNRILRIDDLRERCGITKNCAEKDSYTENDANFRDVVHTAVEKTIEMLTLHLTPSIGGSMVGTNID